MSSDFEEYKKKFSDIYNFADKIEKPLLSKKFRVLVNVLIRLCFKTKTNPLPVTIGDYRGEVGNKIAVYLEDVGLGLWFRIDNVGRVEIGRIKSPNEYFKTEVFTTSDTLLRLREGKIKYINPRTNKFYYDDFTVEDAIMSGFIKYRGDGASADVKRFIEFLKAHPNVLSEIM